MKRGAGIALALMVSCAPVRALTVVELFTSEGCSSCPPAEAVLRKVVEGSPKGVAALAFHVDYWNHLGWKDPFSQKAFTQRQEMYRGAFGLRSLYTPQMVVSGREQFNGSDGRTLDRALKERALDVPEAELWMNGEGEDWVLVRSALPPKAPPGTVGWFFLSFNKAVAAVQRGENAGRTLTHMNVVYSMAMQKDFEGGRTLRLGHPAGKAHGEMRVTVIWQHPKTMAVLAAASDLVANLTP